MNTHNIAPEVNGVTYWNYGWGDKQRTKMGRVIDLNIKGNREYKSKIFAKGYKNRGHLGYFYSFNSLLYFDKKFTTVSYYGLRITKLYDSLKYNNKHINDDSCHWVISTMEELEELNNIIGNVKYTL